MTMRTLVRITLSFVLIYFATFGGSTWALFVILTLQMLTYEALAWLVRR